MFRVIRYFLAITFICYGLVKLLGGQFIYESDWVITARTTDGPTLVWSFFGYSPVYGRLIGLSELVAGLLLLFRRTQTLGAVVLFPITANITVMDFCFDFPPVKYFSLLLTCLCILLLARDHRRLWIAFFQPEPADAGQPGSNPSAERVKPWGWSVRLGFAILAVPAFLFVLNLFGSSVTADPVGAARERCLAEGWQPEDLEFKRWTATGWSGINRESQVDFVGKRAGREQAIHLDLRRPHSFTGWQVTAYHEEPVRIRPTAPN